MDKNFKITPDGAYPEIESVFVNGKTFLVFTRSKNFLGRAIQFWMRLYAIRFWRTNRRAVNHSDIVFDQLATGATAKGVVIRNWEKYFTREAELFVYEVEPAPWVSGDMMFNMMKMYQYRPYDHKNFIDFIVKFFTGRWGGHTRHHAESRLFCIEHSAMLLRDFGVKGFNLKPWSLDPEQLRQWAIDNLRFVGRYKVEA